MAQTLTVRIFSATPVDEIHTLACDTDSHTSVALARIVMARRFGLRPRIVNFDFHNGSKAGEEWNPTVAKLLIGDKVVCQEPRGLSHQLDLGEAWKQMTGLPFVFAAWMARQEVDLGSLPSELERAKRAGLNHVAEIIAQYALPRGWPADIARKYLTEYLQFDIGPRQLEAIRLFHNLAHEYGVIDHPPRVV